MIPAGDAYSSRGQRPRKTRPHVNSDPERVEPWLLLPTGLRHAVQRQCDPFRVGDQTARVPGALPPAIILCPCRAQESKPFCRRLDIASAPHGSRNNAAMLIMTDRNRVSVAKGARVARTRFVDPRFFLARERGRAADLQSRFALRTLTSPPPRTSKNRVPSAVFLVPK